MSLLSAGGKVQRTASLADAAPAEAALSLRELAVEFETPDGQLRALDYVSLTLPRQTTLALVGESGCGKSVTSLAVLRLLPPNARVTGEIRLASEAGHAVDLLTLPAGALRRIRGNRIAMIFQEPMTSLNPLHSIGEQVAEAIRIHQGARPREAWERAHEALLRVGIADARRRMEALPHELSGGMRQRVMIAIALACGPDILIADEPTTALDVTIQSQILELLRNLQAEFGMSMLFISHDLAVVARVAHRVVVMYAGRVVEEGPVRDILKHPRHPYTRGLIASIPRLDYAAGRSHRLQAIPGAVPDLRRLPRGCVFAPRCAHAKSGLCDAAEPALEETPEGGSVRCVRWREIAGGDR